MGGREAQGACRSAEWMGSQEPRGACRSAEDTQCSQPHRSGMHAMYAQQAVAGGGTPAHLPACPGHLQRRSGQQQAPGRAQLPQLLAALAALACKSGGLWAGVDLGAGGRAYSSPWTAGCLRIFLPATAGVGGARRQAGRCQAGRLTLQAVPLIDDQSRPVEAAQHRGIPHGHIIGGLAQRRLRFGC